MIVSLDNTFCAYTECMHKKIFVYSDLLSVAQMWYMVEHLGGWTNWGSNSLCTRPADMRLFEVNWRSPRTTCPTRSTLTSVLIVEVLPLKEPNPLSSCPSLNLLCHSKTHVCDMVFQVLADVVYSNRTKIFRFIRCSVFIVHFKVLIAERPGKRTCKKVKKRKEIKDYGYILPSI